MYGILSLGALLWVISVPEFLRELAKRQTARGYLPMPPESPWRWSVRMLMQFAACIPLGTIVAFAVVAAMNQLPQLYGLGVFVGMLAGTAAIFPLCIGLARMARRTPDFLEPAPFRSASDFAYSLYIRLPALVVRGLFHGAAYVLAFAIGAFVLAGVVGLLMFGIRQL